jgi:hypothetical protein
VAAPAAPAAPQAREREAPAAAAQAPALAEAARSADSVAAPAAQAPAAAAARPAPSPALRRDSAFGIAAWTSLVLSANGRSIEVAQEQAARLGELVNSLARSAQGSEPLAEPVTARVELRREGRSLGVLEVAGPQVRWREMTGRPDAAALQELNAQIERLLPR